MAAVVAFWKLYVAAYVKPLYSRLCSRYRDLATRVKFVSRGSSNTQTCPLESDQSRIYPSIAELSYMEPDEHYQESAGGSSCIVRTEIGRGSSMAGVKGGVIQKFITVEQSFS